MTNRLTKNRLITFGAFVCLFLILLGPTSVFAEVEPTPVEKLPEYILVMDVRQRQIVNWLNNTNFHKKLGFHVPPHEEEALALRQMRGFKQNVLKLRKQFQGRYKEHRVLLLKGEVDIEYYNDEKEQSEERLRQLNTKFQIQYHKFKSVYNNALKQCEAFENDDDDE